MNSIKYLLFLAFFFLITSFRYDQDRISLHLESQRLHKGQVVTTIADLYYSNNDARLVIHYLKPNDYIFVTNSFGEAKAYYPRKNEVVMHQNEIFSSENDALYTFLSNRQYDMGLQDGGFIMTKSQKEDDDVITTWEPRAYNNNPVSKVVLVHENYFPIYMAYYGKDGKILRKTYYSSYFTSTLHPFPTQIVDIDYLPHNDSIISRKRYSSIKTGSEANSTYFDFKIPEKAKLLNFHQPKTKK